MQTTLSKYIFSQCPYDGNHYTMNAEIREMFNKIAMKFLNMEGLPGGKMHWEKQTWRQVLRVERGIH